MSHRRSRFAASLVELLIVIAVIALLLQLALPAVEMSREAARRTHCVNNIRQIVTAANLHVASRRHFPAGGWSWQWVGDSSRGTGRGQPGSWIYNSLPFLDEQAVHDATPTAVQSISLKIFHCPSRRIAKAYPNHWRFQPHNAEIVDTHARSDYAANGGDVYSNLGPGPGSYEESESDGYVWSKYPDKATGIVFSRSLVRPADVTDGLSNTYFVGEKYLARINYLNGIEDGDDFTMYQGDDMDIVRWTMPVVTDYAKHFIDRPNMPRRDDKNFVTAYAFGSAHPAGWHAAHCDGSARLISYDVSEKIHQNSGNRFDGEAIAESQVGPRAAP